MESKDTLNTKEAPDIKTEETELKELIIYQLNNNMIKWKEVLKMAGSNATLSKNWKGGSYNSAEELATAAVAEAYEVRHCLNTECIAGLRRIADFVQMPYIKLLQYYVKSCILTGAAPTYSTYIDYNTLKE